MVEDTQVMATVPDKSGNAPVTGGVDQHVYTAAEMRSTKVTDKVRPGSPSANTPFVPVP
jgi:hypothetical protein